MINLKTQLLNHLNETDLKGILSIRRKIKKMLITTFSNFYSKEELKSHNKRVREGIKLVDEYLLKNYPNELTDFIEYEGNRIPKSKILILVWEDEEFRDQGVNCKMDGGDFQGSDFESLIDSIKGYYKDEIKRNKGCIEVEVNGKLILHISPESKNKWEVI
jgi:hypothetical protein